MARLEVELMGVLRPGDIARELAARMPGRSLTAIQVARCQQPYRTALQAALDEDRERAREPPTVPREAHDDEETARKLYDTVLKGIAEVSALGLQQHESLLVAAREALLGGDPHVLLVDWYKGLCPPPQPAGRVGGVPPQPPQFEARRDRYRRYQQMWVTDRPALAQEVTGSVRGRRVHTAAQLSTYWGRQWSVPSPAWDPETQVRAPQDGDMSKLWCGVTVQEVAKSEPGRTACGPDGMTAGAWREVPRKVRALFFNVVLKSGAMPPQLLKARTTMLPKTQRPRTEAEYRPITVSSVAVRQLHRILAMRMDGVVRHAAPQRGLIRYVDGIGANVAAMDDILRDARAKHRELRLAIVDVEKAFDRVSHQAITNIMAGRGWPPSIVRYVENVYGAGTTSIGGGPDLMVARGIRQGDPLSSVLFNIVMDHVLLALPARIGYTYGGVRINALAFADDVVLVASSEAGIRTLAAQFASALAEVGLNVNHAKSLYIPLVARGGRLVLPREGATLPMGGRELTSAELGVSWTYLGVPFGVTGSIAVRPREVLEVMDRLAVAPLKPLQRLEMLRTHVLPSFLHRLVLASTSKKVLEQVDLRSRALVRRWLRLPADSANAYIHGPVGDGGLGVMQLAVSVPPLRAQRMARARSAVWGAELTFDGPTSQQRRAQAAMKLHATVDGAELVNSRCSWASTMWLRQGNAFSGGWRGVNMVRVHSGSLPTRVRMSRGRRNNLPAACRAGCAAMETAAHAIQVCPVTRLARVGRHNHACRLLATYAVKKGWHVWEEPHFQLGGRGFKPDLVIRNRTGTYILEISVCLGGSGARPVERVSQQKASKYTGTLMAEAVAGLTGCLPTEVRVLAVTITWKGVWDPASVKGLTKIGYPRFLINWVTSGVLAGSAMIWSAFMKESRRRRRGRPPRVPG